MTKCTPNNVAFHHAHEIFGSVPRAYKHHVSLLSVFSDLYLSTTGHTLAQCCKVAGLLRLELGELKAVRVLLQNDVCCSGRYLCKVLKNAE